MISEQRVRAIQLVSYSDTEDEDETAQLDCTPKAPSQSLVSLDSESAAADNKEICPPNLCKMKKANKRSWWVQCSVVECGQWYHQRCVGISKRVAERDNFTCPKCC